MLKQSTTETFYYIIYDILLYMALWAHGAHGAQVPFRAFKALWAHGAHGAQVPFRAFKALWAHKGPI